MSVLLRKEIRGVLHAWMASVAAATLPLWHVQLLSEISVLFFGVAILSLGLAPIGQEMMCGTFGMLLAQPQERIHFWRMKASLLAAAMLSAWMVFACSVYISGGPDGLGHIELGALLAGLAFSGALWSTLLLRDVTAAFLCTCLTPLALWMATMIAAAHWVNPERDEEALMRIVYGVFAVYIVAGYFWGRWLFLTAQDVPWTGGQISWNADRFAPTRWLMFKFNRRQSRWTALARKELQLQEIAVFLIPVLTLSFFAAVAVGQFNQDWRTGIEAVAAIWLAAVPFLIGAVSVAEERRLNTWESTLCLPVKKLASFAIKLGLTMALGIVLGGIIPWLLVHFVRMQGDSFLLNVCIGIAALVTGVAFYGSTMSRGLLQAIPVVFAICMLRGVAMVFAASFFGQTPVFQTNLYQVMVWPAMTAVLLWLAFQNYQRLQITRWMWAENFVIAGATLVCVMLAASGIYNRAWEFFMTLEPAHGPAQISGAGEASMVFLSHDIFDKSYGRKTLTWKSEAPLCILLPDGRLWVGQVDHAWSRQPDSSVRQTIAGVSGQFAPGSNWVKVAATDGMIAMTSDGAIWDARQLPPKRIDGKNGPAEWNKLTAPVAPRYNQPAPWKLKGTNWISIVDFGNQHLGIRRDGTLWASGYLPETLFGEHVPRERTWEGAIQVGTNSDWKSLSGDGIAVALRGKGSFWVRQYNGEKQPSRYSDWITVAMNGAKTWALAQDGTLLCWDVFGTHEPPNRPGAQQPTFWQSIYLGPTRKAVFSTNILNGTK